MRSEGQPLPLGQPRGRLRARQAIASVDDRHGADGLRERRGTGCDLRGLHGEKLHGPVALQRNHLRERDRCADGKGRQSRGVGAPELAPDIVAPLLDHRLADRVVASWLGHHPATPG